MLLKSVEIQGFKTFPDKTSLKFDEKTVAVVGPNGSGKSNVSDAIRWVLGEQSARILRCSKMEDVIFKGTTTRKPQGFAEVTMNIDNSDRTLNFDSDSVAITRRYYRSGESEYLINKASVRLKDINELFMDTGLGRDGYSIIGQGKIDTIVAAKSEERREIFEEASGISKYRYRKEESERRLSRAEDNLVRLRDILQELEGRVEPLRLQSEKAKKFLEFDREKRGLEIGVWVKNLSSFEKDLRVQSEKTQITLAQYNDIEEKIEEISNKNQQNYQNNSILNAQIDSERKNATSYDEEILRENAQVAIMQNDIQHNKQNIQRILDEISDAENSNENIDTRISELNKLLEIYVSEIDLNNNTYIDLSYKAEDLRKGLDQKRQKFMSLSQKNIELNASLSSKKIESSAIISSLNEIKVRTENIDEAISENLNNQKKLELEKQKTESFLQEIETSITKSNNIISAFNLKINSEKEKETALKKEIDEINLSAMQESRRASLLEDLERNLEGFANSVKTVMKDFERGLLSGVHGPVTKIIKTSSKYAVAMETALGGAMQNIVVDNEANAKSAINLLKKKNSGRATFLPISTIRANVIDVREVENLDGFIGIASELVSCEPIYDGIKKSLLGRTVVAENLDSAVIIAKKSAYRFRVVSLDGQVVNAGGSLTGGALAKNSGLLSRSAEIEKIKQKAEEFKLTLAQKSQEYKKITDKLTETTQELEEEKARQLQMTQDKVKTVAEISSIGRELESTISFAKQLSLEKENSSVRVSSLEDENSKILEVSQNTMKEIVRLDTEIKELDRLQTLSEEEINEISQKMQELKIKILALQKDKEATQSSVDSLKERKTDSDALFTRLDTQKNLHEAQIEEFEIKIVEIQSKIESLSIKSKTSKENVEAFVKERQKLEIIEKELRETERALLGDRENASKELARLQERMDSMQKEYDTIIKKLWEEYELTRKEAEQQAIEIEDLRKASLRLTELRSKIRSLGSVNTASIEEYEEVSERYEFLKVQVADVEKSKTELLKIISELTHNMKEQFAIRFAEIAKNFTEIFKELFGGGTASLSFTDDSDILNSGIDIKVHPPGKIVSHIEALSGGEKALVAISIYFAIMKVSPPPFCMLDEVEAALDDVNVRRFAEYLQRMNDKTQFIVITHRRGTMELADMLYGVTMQEDGISKLLALKSAAESIEFAEK